MTRWIVTPTDSQAADLGATAKALESRGMQVEETLDQLGLIIGTASDATAQACRQLPGIASIDSDRGVQIAPPDADVQ